MRKLKVSFLCLFAATLFFTSCQKETTDQALEQNIAEQSEVIEDNPENLLMEKVAPEVGEKQLATSGMKSHLDRPENEVLRPGQGDAATSRSSTWISCGDTKHGSTIGQINNYSGHLYKNGCLDKYYPFNAPDKKYLIHVPDVTDVTFELTHLHKDLDLFVFTADWWYNPDYCIGSNGTKVFR
ncbi:MAG: hypothetical protein AAF960_28115 [Bacteroidota bacterium]